MSQIATKVPSEYYSKNNNQLEKKTSPFIDTNSLTELLLHIQHDIKSPISNIIGLINIISDTENLPEKFKKYINYIKISSEQLLHLISQNLENYSCIKQNQKQSFNLTKLITNILKLHIISIKNKNLQINLHHDPKIPQQLIVDQNKLYKIFANLLDNAIKFTNKGSITISTKLIKVITKKQAKYQQAIVQLTIKDTGIGIAKNQTRLVFQRFTKLSPNNLNAKFLSSGLGLWAVKKLIQEINGKIYIASAKGVGTTFRCIVPCKLLIKDCKNFKQ